VLVWVLPTVNAIIEWSNHSQSAFGLLAAERCLVNLQGFANAIVFFSTRNLVPLACPWLSAWTAARRPITEQSPIAAAAHNAGVAMAARAGGNAGDVLAGDRVQDWTEVRNPVLPAGVGPLQAQRRVHAQAEELAGP
jgi:hypothetical protein